MQNDVRKILFIRSRKGSVKFQVAHVDFALYSPLVVRKGKATAPPLEEASFIRSMPVEVTWHLKRDKSETPH